MIILDKPFPKNCEECPFHARKRYRNSSEVTMRWCVVAKLNCDTFYYKRHPECPLKEGKYGSKN